MIIQLSACSVMLNPADLLDVCRERNDWHPGGPGRMPTPVPVGNLELQSSSTDHCDIWSVCKDSTRQVNFSFCMLYVLIIMFLASALIVRELQTIE